MTKTETKKTAKLKKRAVTTSVTKKLDNTAKVNKTNKKAATGSKTAAKSHSKKSAGKRVTKERVTAVLDLLDKEYGTDVVCYLDHTNTLQLLIATMLSAQCTDARVNMVTPALFRKYKNAKAFANADLKELEEMIQSTGFYHNKAKNIIACCKTLVEEYGGEVPYDMEALTSLPGVGRKTANVVRGNSYGEPSVVVDTHVGRITRKLGFTKETDPEKVEYDLMKILPKENWIRYNMQIITLGRTICTARKTDCENCFLKGQCPSANFSSDKKRTAKVKAVKKGNQLQADKLEKKKDNKV